MLLRIGRQMVVLVKAICDGQEVIIFFPIFPIFFTLPYHFYLLA